MRGLEVNTTQRAWFCWILASPKIHQHIQTGRKEPKQKINSLAELEKRKKNSQKPKPFIKTRPLIIEGLVWKGKTQPGPSAAISRRMSFSNQHGKGSGSPWQEGWEGGCRVSFSLPWQMILTLSCSSATATGDKAWSDPARGLSALGKRL